MKRWLIIFLTICCATLPMAARRTVTPVGDPSVQLPATDSLPTDEWIDSIATVQPKAIGNIYPLWDAVQVSVDLWPALNRAFNSHYGLGGIAAQLSLHNRYFPAVEIGVNQAKYKPEGMNFAFRSPVAPYFKIGCGYNFLYNSNPAYKLLVLARYGLTPFSYQFTDVTLSSAYWDDSQTLNFPKRHSFTGYYELGAELQVRLASRWSAGWSVRYHGILHHNSEPNGAPWCVPGYGVRSNHLGITLSITYTIPLHNEETTTHNEN